MLLPGRWIEFLRFFCNLLNSLDFLVHVYCACMQSDNKLNIFQKFWMCEEINCLEKRFKIYYIIYYINILIVLAFLRIKIRQQETKNGKSNLEFSYKYLYKIWQIFRHFSWQLISSHIQNFWLVSMMLQSIQLLKVLYMY